MRRNKKNGFIEVDEKRAYEWCFEKGCDQWPDVGPCT
jgi:hypothetical protein